MCVKSLSLCSFVIVATGNQYISIHLYFLPGFSVQFSAVSHVRLFATPWTVARQASLSITNSWTLPKLTSIESVMPSNHLILCHPLLLLPFPSLVTDHSFNLRCPGVYWHCPLWSSGHVLPAVPRALPGICMKLLDMYSVYIFPDFNLTQRFRTRVGEGELKSLLFCH